MSRQSSEDVARVIRREYADLPGLNLTFWQVQRLWDLPEDVCRQALGLLTQSRFLIRSQDGAYIRPAITASE